MVFHMISCLTELGRVGLTAVGNTPGRGDGPLPARRAGPARRGDDGRPRGGASGMTPEPIDSALVRRVRLEPERQPLPPLPAGWSPARQPPHLPRVPGPPRPRAHRTPRDRGSPVLHRLVGDLGRGHRRSRPVRAGQGPGDGLPVRPGQLATCWPRRCAASPGRPRPAALARDGRHRLGPGRYETSCARHPRRDPAPRP